MSYRYSLVLLAFLLSACDAVSSQAIAPLSAPDAKATAIVANAAADAAVVIDSNRQIQQAAQNNAKLQETQTAIAVTQQAQSIALVQATIDAAHLQATQTAQSIHTAATMDALSIISTENQVTTTQAIRAAEVDKKTSPGYTLLESQAWPALVFGAVLIILAIAVAIIIVVLGVSARGHVAKKFEAGGQVWFVPMIGRPVPLLLADPTAPPDEDEDQGNEMVTGNRVTGNSSVTREGNTSETPEMTLNSSQGSGTLHQYTDSQWAKLQETKEDALELLRRSMEYHRSRGVIDTGEIPRYNHINCKPEWRGAIVDNLVVSRLATKGPKGTFVTHEGGETLRELYHRITRNDKRVYPVGFNQFPPEPLDPLARAIKKALPLQERSAD